MLDYIVYIGRFQPLHEGHRYTLRKAKEIAKKVIVLIGSSNVGRSPKNPWTYEERASWFCEDRNVICAPINDAPENDTTWITGVRDAVNSVVKEPNAKIGIIAFNKDASSYYLNLFPEWEKHDVTFQYGTLNATDIRRQYFQDAPIISEFLPNNVRVFLKEFALSPEFKWLLNEQKYLDAYRKEWENTPYPPVFVTVDAIVEQAGSVLLVERRDPPFAGRLAIPGGFLNHKERINDAVVRELKEETRIEDAYGEVPPAKLKSFIVDSKVFDHPERSARGRTITHAFYFKLPAPKDTLWKVRGDDDAKSAKWYNLADLNSRQFMEDHWFILQHFTGVQ